MNIASIDIGTNTVLLLIAKVDPYKKNFAPLINVHRMPRLGKGLKPGLAIKREKIDELRNILVEYKAIINSYEAAEVIVTATNAFRIADNSQVIVNEIRRDFGFDINIISGEEEASLSFLGATSGIDVTEKKFLVIDIGGGSTEIIMGKRNKIEYKRSFQIGAVSATENFLLSDPPEQTQQVSLEIHLQSLFGELSKINKKDYFPVAIAGTPTTLSCIKHNLQIFDSEVIELSELSMSKLREIVGDLSAMTSYEIDQKWKYIMRGRADIILAGSLILFNLMQLLNLDKVYTSSPGIRHGAIVKYLSELNL